MEQDLVIINDLSYSYQGEEKPVLNQISINFKAGEFITLTGPSGCGKTTLALSLTGFIPHYYSGTMLGSVTIDGVDTKDVIPGMLAGIVGMVQQDPEMQICTLKVIDEVAFGPENLYLPYQEVKSRSAWALEAVGATNLAERNVYTLSGGEKQRVAIAAVLAMKPKLIILDEPTANLDPNCTGEVLMILERLRRDEGTTILILEHRFEKLIPLSNRILTMTEGKIEEVVKGYESRELRALLPVVKYPFLNSTPEELTDEDLTPRLSIENLEAGHDKLFLKNVNFSVYPGEITAIMGDNGSGKTTLLFALLGLIKNVKGRILLDGKDISGDKVSKRARIVGLSFQNPNHQIFENTVLKEAEMTSLFLKGCFPGENQKVLELLESFELITYIDRVPFALSMGEKKRLTLLSLIAYGPDFLALDEPLVGQDAKRSLYLYNTLVEYRKRGGVVLMVCHEPAVVSAWCQRLLFLKNGELLVDDHPERAFEKMASMELTHYLPAGYRKNAIEDELQNGYS